MASVGKDEDEPSAIRGVVPSREDVAADVRKVVGACRSRGDFQRLETPAIDQLLALRKLGHDDGPDLLARAIAVVEPERYRRFLQLLLPLPFHEGERWPSLGPSRQGPGRGDLAAAEFGLDTWDGCTRPSITLDDRSRRDWAELHLATALIQVANREPDAEAVVDEAEVPVPVVSRWRPRVSTLVAAAAGLLVLALVTVFLVRIAGDDGDSGGRSAPEVVDTTAVPEDVLGEQCVPVGELDGGLSAQPDAAVDSATLRDIYDRADQTRALGCAIAPATDWHGLIVQPLESGEADLPAAIVASGPSTGVVLGPSQWGSYKRIGSANGEMVMSVGGPPQRIVERPDGVVEIELETGVLMVGESRDAPFFWILGKYVPFWRAHQSELGLPTSNPSLPGSQDFQRGSAVLADLGAPEPELRLDPDPAGSLPPASRRRGHILRQTDGTAWFVDRQDRRHWIATGPVWECLGGEAEAVDDPVSGTAISSLPAGDHAECPD